MSITHLPSSLVLGCALAAATLATGCLTSNVDPTSDAGTGEASAAIAGDPTKNEANKDAIPYRVARRPSGLHDRRPRYAQGERVRPATIPGYKCAAKAYPLVNEDAKKPIVLLMHGNSSTPADWEKFPADKADALPMLADRLSAQGFRVLAVDFRYDKVDDPAGEQQDRERRPELRSRLGRARSSSTSSTR